MKINTNHKLSPFKNLNSDIPASIVVFLVAMPLCLGIAMASGAPLFAGLISGIIGGVVVGALSESPLGVSGPAAGLAVIVLNAITDLGGFEIFLVSVILAGIIQLIMGFAKAGFIAYYFPSSVIHGMLAGIGIIIFIKQIPHAFGYDKDPEGDFGFSQVDGHNTFSELSYMLDNISLGVLTISVVSLAILLLWETSFIKNLKMTKYIQGPLVAVVTGVVLGVLFESIPSLKISSDHFVSVPISDSISGFFNSFTFPDFGKGLSNPDVYTTAIVIAVVASLETLLCVEATDKQDTLKRITPTNRELKAQGVGNIISGFIGGLPITQVIVRSSANMQSGGKTKASAFLHGVLLLLSVVVIPNVLNLIPLGVLAAILFVVGYKLAKPALFKKMYIQGMGQFIPFVITVVGIVFTDLLTGIALGLMIAIFIILKNNFTVPFKVNEEVGGNKKMKICLSEDVTFLNKASIQKVLSEIPDETELTIDASNNHFIHYDVIEIIEDFKISAVNREIKLTIIDLYEDIETKPQVHFEINN